MRKRTFNKKITLLKLAPQSRTEKPLETARAVVWADVSEPGVTVKFAAMQAGQDVQFSVVMWRAEFKNYTHCEIDGVRFKIVETGAAKNALHIKLLLERG